jgi:hypothetical protein
MLGGLMIVWLLKKKADEQLDDEYPMATFGGARTQKLKNLAIGIAADTADDAEAIAAIKAADSKRMRQKRAAAEIRSNRLGREHRNQLRAARLLKAAADGTQPVTASADEETLFRAVDDLEAHSGDDAFAVLVAEVPALGALERQVTESRSSPDWEDRDAGDRRFEIIDNLARLIGPEALSGSILIRSHTAFSYARAHLLRKAGLV